MRQEIDLDIVKRFLLSGLTAKAYAPQEGLTPEWFRSKIIRYCMRLKRSDFAVPEIKQTPSYGIRAIRDNADVWIYAIDEYYKLKEKFYHNN